MRKRIVSLILIMALLFCAMPMTATAAGTLEGVDYTRIEQNSSLEKEVTFLVGDREFTGTLSNGKTLTDEEVDEIIRGVMTSKNITSGMLIGAQQRASDGLRYNEDRYVQPTVLVEYALASSDIASAQELSQIISGNKPIPTNAQFYTDLLTDTAVNKLFDFALGKLVGEPASKFISALQNILEIGGREYDEYAADEERVMQSLAAAMALEEFYSLCNAEIKKVEKERGLNQWSLTCAQTVWTKRNLFGSLPVTQYWRLYCDLDRTNTTDDVTNWGGTYTGYMKLDIWHDMTAFDEQFVNWYRNSDLPTRTYDEMAKSTLTDNSPGGSYLYKTLENWSFTIALDPGMAENGEFTKPFSFAGFEDNSSFWTVHNIRSGSNLALYEDGHASLGGDHVDVEDVFSFLGEMANNNKAIQLDMYTKGQQLSYDFRGLDEGEIDSLGMDCQTVETDNTVFEDLRIIPTITIKGAN